MKKKIFIGILAAAIAVPAAIITTIALASDSEVVPSRPEGPCGGRIHGGQSPDTWLS